MRIKAGILIAVVSLMAPTPIARAQSLITTIALGPNQIGQVKTTQGITTRIAFPDTVRDIICGDLYDASTGKGSFVIQRIDNDVFLKPVVSKGISNLFVKTGEKGDNTYSFDLVVVPLAEAYRVVNVTGPAKPQGSQVADSSPKAQQQAEEVLNNARQQAAQIISQAEQRAAESDRKAVERSSELERRAEQEVQQRFVRAMIQGVREVKLSEPRVNEKRITILLDPRVLTFDARSYLRYTIKNNGDKEFTFSAISLEKGAGKEVKAIPAEVIQGRAENRIKPGETIIGIIVFDPKLVSDTDRLMLYVRGENNLELARMNIQ
jgi:hypothetical protein